jgi:cis-3-alkyl-4-acyloxetan-2-one decarboxylase
MPNSPQNEAIWRSLYPFASRWVGVPGGRMHYVDEGPTDYSGAKSRETLLFVHGNPTWSFHWRRLIVALRRNYRCVAVDHLGCGLSEKPARFLSLDDHIRNLVAFIHHLELSRLTLVAQDWGGLIGLGAMLRIPERSPYGLCPERIVLFNTGAFPPRYIPWRIRACRIPGLGRLAVQGANLFSRAALRMTLARKTQLEPDVAAGYLDPYDSWPNRRAVYGFVEDIPNPRRQVSPNLATEFGRNSAKLSTEHVLAEIERELPRFADRPASLVWGMQDWCFRPDCLERFVAAWPNAEVHRLADVGHWVVEDAPDESLAIVEEFLARTSQRQLSASP